MTHSLITVTEANFARQVRAARQPVVVFFATPWCEVCAALAPLLQRLADEYAGHMIIAVVHAEEETLLAEEFHVTAVPTLLALRDGEEITRVIGFAPEGLLRMFFADLVADTLPQQWLWSPTERAYEDAVLLPLLTAWGLHYARQVTCAIRTEGRATSGRADVVVYRVEGQLLTLFENKRVISSTYDLQQAAQQGHAYAHALGLPAFVVAAPTGMWLYLVKGQNMTLVQQFSALDVAIRAAAIKMLLLELAQ